VPAGTLTLYRIYAELVELVTLALTVTAPRLLLVKISEVIRVKFFSASVRGFVAAGTVRRRLPSALSTFVGELKTLDDTLEGSNTCAMIQIRFSSRLCFGYIDELLTHEDLFCEVQS
jgi:hypothetical protein|tara:strand:- start:675 stop:1025 length:351 start_codon:yes stop_codon:yes gene_type:complete